MASVALMRQAGDMRLPGPFRAAIGLAATAAEEARHLPERAIELPMLAVSTALQVSLRAQQRYARLAARGDDVLNRRPAGDEPPSWATFDEPLSPEELRRTAFDPLDGRNFPISRTFAELFGTDEPGPDGATDETPELSVVDEGGTRRPPARATAKKPARKASAKKATPAVKSAAKKAPAKAQKSTAKKPAAKNGKTVNKPRHAAPSRFDQVSDADLDAD